MTTTSPILNGSISDANFYRCENHFNCSRRFLSLDTYCCERNGECCNWFQFMYNFNNKTGSSLVPYKSPTILTVFTMLILFVCLLFVSYCISILFCYCFKCGLFKRPRVVVISAVPIDNVSSASSDTTSMISSPKPHQSNSYRQRSKVGAKRNLRSPTARAVITNDCDNDSPFLIPSSNRSSTSSSNRRKNTNRHHSTRSESNNSYRTRSNNIQRRISLQQEHSSQLPNRQLNTFETVNGSIRSSRSSLSLDLHEIRTANELNTRQEVEPSAPSYYQDEKPPAYDEIVGRNY
jgi:hypothetical protein